MNNCPSYNIDPDELDCSKKKKNYLLLHPDKNIGCIKESTEKIKRYKNRCEDGIKMDKKKYEKKNKYDNFYNDADNADDVYAEPNYDDTWTKFDDDYYDSYDEYLNEDEKEYLSNELKKAISKNDIEKSKSIIDQLDKGTIEMNIHYAIKVGILEIVKYMIENGVDIETKRGQLGGLWNTPLMTAVINDRIEIVKYLVEKGARINDWNSNRREYPIATAIRRDNLEMVKYLIKNGANIDLPDRNGIKIYEKLRQKYSEDPYIREVINEYKDEKVEWKVLCKKLGTESLNQLREFAKELNIRYNFEEIYEAELRKDCKMGYIRNPMSKRCVKASGPIGRKLMSDNIARLMFEKKVLCKLLSQSMQ